MSVVEKKLWGIHTLDDKLFLTKKLIAIGWREFGDLTKVEGTREAFKTHYAESFPESKKEGQANAVYHKAYDEREPIEV